MQACVENVTEMDAAVVESVAVADAVVADEGRGKSSHNDVRGITPGIAMIEELKGVPKPALEAVFGKEFGQRLWRQVRRLAGAAPVNADQLSAGMNTSAISDAEIVSGMIGYLCRQAESTLLAAGRHGTAITLVAAYADGVTVQAKSRLARPTNAASEIFYSATELSADLLGRDVAVVSLELKVTSVERESAQNGAPGILTEPSLAPLGDPFFQFS